ncbi:hypothetical protein F5B18DRAFT_625174 [Nemania serpens]|nr:hypothetical protein F5B18DRAFT_625174 [Nemania serpens]
MPLYIAIVVSLLLYLPRSSHIRDKPPTARVISAVPKSQVYGRFSNLVYSDEIRRIDDRRQPLSNPFHAMSPYHRRHGACTFPSWVCCLLIFQL